MTSCYNLSFPITNIKGFVEKAHSRKHQIYIILISVVYGSGSQRRGRKVNELINSGITSPFAAFPSHISLFNYRLGIEDIFRSLLI